MIGFPSLFLITYFLSFVGYGIGHMTKEEHKDISLWTKYLIPIFIILTYLGFVLYNPTILTITIGIIGIICMSLFLQYKKTQQDTARTFFLAISLLIFYMNFRAELIVLPLLALVVQNGTRTWEWKKEILDAIAPIIIAVLFIVVPNL